MKKKLILFTGLLIAGLQAPQMEATGFTTKLVNFISRQPKTVKVIGGIFGFWVASQSAFAVGYKLDKKFGNQIDSWRLNRYIKKYRFEYRYAERRIQKKLIDKRVEKIKNRNRKRYQRDSDFRMDLNLLEKRYIQCIDNAGADECKIYEELGINTDFILNRFNKFNFKKKGDF